MVRVPKVESTAQIARLDAVLGFLEARRGIEAGTVRIGVALESPGGVLQALGIASASPRVAAMGGGGLDYHAEMRSEPRPDRMECLYLYSTILHVCRACGIDPIYSIYPAIHDLEGLARDSEWARSMGFVGRSCLHPKQVAPVNAAFGPSPEKVDWAKRVVAAVREGRTRGYGEVTMDGVLIGPPTLIEVRRILAMAGPDRDPGLMEPDA